MAKVTDKEGWFDGEVWHKKDCGFKKKGFCICN